MSLEKAHKTISYEHHIFEAIFNSKPEMMAVFSRGEIVYYNTSFADFFGIEELDRGKATLIFKEKVLEKNFLVIEKKVNEVLSSKQKVHFILNFLNSYQEKRWIDCSAEEISESVVLLNMNDFTETKLAEDAFETNLNFLNSLIETIPNPLFYKNTQGIIIGCNQSFADLFGKNKFDIIGKKTSFFLDSDLAAIIDKQNEKLISHDQPITYELSLPTLEGDKHLIIHKKSFTQSEKGQKGILGVITDITIQKHTENQLIENRNKFQLLLEEAPFGIIQCDISGSILYLNKKIQEISGAKNFETIKAFNLLRDDYFKTSNLIESFEKSIETQERTEFEFHSVTPWGNSLHAIFIVNPIVLNDNVDSFLIIVQDISERFKAQQILKASEERYRSLAENSSDGIWIINFNSEIIYANKALEELTGYNIDEFKERKLETFMEPESYDRFSQVFKHCNDAIDDHEAEFPSLDLVLIHKNKSRIWLEVNISYYKNRSGKIIGVQAISRDVSKRVEIIENLRKAKEKAEHTDKLKTAFVANISHEIRTPLNSILGFSDFLSNPDLPVDEREEYLKYIKNNGFLLLHLINEITDTSKIEAGKIQIELSECDVNEVLKEIHHTFSVTKTKTDLELILDIPETKSSLVILSDNHRLKQAFINLISNAFKFTDCGHIRFGYTLEKEMIKFFVVDTGIGIPENKYDLIFTRFGQVEENYTRNTGGTGLGLSLAKSFIELLGGEIWFESELNKGTTFFFTLPLRLKDNTDTPKEKTQPKQMKEYNWTGKHLLIAEDADMNFILLERLLRKTGISVTRAENGQIALEKFKANNFDLILMDMQMPEVDGFEATKAIKKLNSEIPIIAQTAFAMDGEEEKVIEAGCNDYVSKPINKFELFKKINAFLGFE